VLKSSIVINGIHLAVAVAGWAASGFKTVTEDIHMERSVHCSICPRWDARKGRCEECGCYGAKHWLASEKCPLGKWPSVG